MKQESSVRNNPFYDQTKPQTKFHTSQWGPNSQLFDQSEKIFAQRTSLLLNSTPQQIFPEKWMGELVIKSEHSKHELGEGAENLQILQSQIQLRSWALQIHHEVLYNSRKKFGGENKQKDAGDFQFQVSATPIQPFLIVHSPELVEIILEVLLPNH